MVEPNQYPCNPLPVLRMCPSPRAAACESLSIPCMERRAHDSPLQIAMDSQTRGKSHERDFPLGIPGAKGTRYRLHFQRFKSPWRVPNASITKNATARYGQWQSPKRHSPVGIPGAKGARYRLHSRRSKAPWTAPNAVFPKNAMPRHRQQVNYTIR